MQRFPILISIPHGGLKIPPEVAQEFAINEEDILMDADACTREIYHVPDLVHAIIETEYARAIVDVNCPANGQEESFSRMAVRKITFYGRSIYKRSSFPEEELVQLLQDRYYYPYYKKVEEALAGEKVKLGLDCHAMDPTGPPVLQSPGKKRPMVCIGNREGRAASAEMAELLALCFREALSLPKSEVTLNKPFQGGELVRHFGLNPIPWLQIELNKELYAAEFDAQRIKFRADKQKVAALNLAFRKILNLFISRLEFS